MDVMFIDGEALTDYGAELVEWDYGAELTNSILTGKNYAFPSLLRSEIGQGTLSATIHLIGKDAEDADNRTAKLLNRLNKTVDLQMPDNFLYRSALSKASPSRFTDWIVELELEFIAIKHLQYLEISGYQSGSKFYYQGYAPSGLKIEFDVPAGITTVSVSLKLEGKEVFGTLISNLTGGAHVIIDGIEKSITQNGENKFSDSSLIDFPMLSASERSYSLVFSETVSNIKIGYFPTYM